MNIFKQYECGLPTVRSEIKKIYDYISTNNNHFNLELSGSNKFYITPKQEKIESGTIKYISINNSKLNIPDISQIYTLSSEESKLFYYLVKERNLSNKVDQEIDSQNKLKTFINKL